MTLPPFAARLERAIADLPRAYQGPGGAVAVVRDGEILVRHAWGWADAERRIPFTPRSLFRVCSVTKQFTCALLLDLFPDPGGLDGALAARLPRLEAAPPRVLDLCHNQSGLRDYWALAMLCGAPAESPFGDAEAAALVGGIRTLQFAPGTRASYSNTNFRLLSDLLEERTGRSFAELLRRRVLDPAGMGGAILAADTRALPDGTEGYEGTPAAGFRPAVNRILWTGDAGLAASLDDMIAWERAIDGAREDAGSPYRRLSAPVSFSGGALAPYGFGLARHTEMGRAVTGHGGALRGWRSHRLHVAAERLSVVVLFNHMADARAAALSVLAAALGEGRPAPDPALPMPDWGGSYLEPETGLSARIAAGAPGQVDLRFTRTTDRLDLRPDGTAGRDEARLRPGPGGLWLDRPADNLSSLLRRLPDSGGGPDLAGLYRCDALDAELTIADAGGALYAACSGPFGHGRMEALDPVAADVLAMPCPRALDHTPPGDWTLHFRRDAAGRAEGVAVGCWLARGLDYRRVG